MKESIFSSAIRSFFVSLFAIGGLLVGLIIMIAVIGGLSSTTESEPDINHIYTPQILPNAVGIRKSLASDVPVILKININGVIGTENLTQKKMDELLIESRERSLKNDRVKAILLHINSPGGTVVDADSIYRSLKAYKETHKTPVYAYVDGLCASGGVYVASAADKIYASDVSLIGSVGVILSSALNFSQLMEKVGVQSMTLYDGKGKDNLNPLRPWVKGEQDNIQDAINYYYGMFVDIVTSNRPHLSKEKLVNVYGANIYPAALAKEYGYIDEHNYTLQKTLKELANDVGIHDDNYQFIELTSSSWITELLNGKFNLLHGHVTHQIDLNTGFSPDLQNKFLYLYRN